MKFDSVVKRLREEVRQAEYLANDSMLRLLLGMSAASRPLETSAVAHFNDISDKICECDYSSFLIGRIEDRRAPRKKIGNFYVGAGFEDCYGVQKDPSKVRVIDFGALASPRVWRNMVSAMQDEYLDLISLNLFREFVQEFEQETLLANDLGASVLDLRTLLAMDGSFTKIYNGRCEVIVALKIVDYCTTFVD